MVQGLPKGRHRGGWPMIARTSVWLVIAMMSLGSFGALGIAGCHEKQELTPPPPPLRPDPEPAPDTKKVEKDCEPIDPQAELKPMTFDERSIPEGMRLADQATGDLRTSSSGEVDRVTREQMLT